MRRALDILCLVAIGQGFAVTTHAGAWTLPEGDTQIIANVTASEASRVYDHRSKANVPIKFDKLFSQIDVEYGWGDRLTTFVAPEFDDAKWTSPGGMPDRHEDIAVSSGVRYRLFSTFGVGSIEASMKSGGARDSGAAVDVASGRQTEVRFLYGTSFKVFGHYGFVDVEAAHRWLVGAQPDETPVDLTVGIHIRQLMVMLQSFNVISDGNASPPFTYYRSHKLQLSLVRDIGRSGLSLQIGGFFSPAGQNSLDEKGLVAAVWARF